MNYDNYIKIPIVLLSDTNVSSSAKLLYGLLVLLTYQEGYYESLVISIGDANGDNFWCVLFPNFCLVDREEHHTYKSYFKELINKIF